MKSGTEKIFCQSHSRAATVQPAASRSMGNKLTRISGAEPLCSPCPCLIPFRNQTIPLSATLCGSSPYHPVRSRRCSLAFPFSFWF